MNINRRRTRCPNLSKYRGSPVALSLLMAIVWFSGCGSHSSASGPPDQWIRGKDLSVRVSFSEGKIGMRNDGNQEVVILPMTLRGWYKTLGEKEVTIRSGEIEALKPGQQLSVPIPPFQQLEPPPGGLVTAEEIHKLQVELGPKRSTEVFTVQR